MQIEKRRRTRTGGKLGGCVVLLMGLGLAAELAAAQETATGGAALTPSQPQALNQPGTARGDVFTQDLLTGDWGGFRKTLEEDGMKIAPTYYGEVFGNPSGGRRQGVTYDGLFDVEFDLDLGKMGGGDWTDTTVHASAEEIHGEGLSRGYVGDFSNTSDIADDNTLRLQELWVQKLFWKKKLSVKAGNLAVDTDFFQSASAALFINGTLGTFTLIANNLPNAPVYPLASPGVRVELTPDPAWYVMAGVYGQDIHSNPATNNQNGTRFALTASSGLLVMSEAGYLLNQGPNDQGLQGSYRLGSFVHSDDSQKFEGGSGGTGYGIYGVLDQQIFSAGDEIVSFFVRSGGAPAKTNFVDYYVDGGFNFTGFVPGRKQDVGGLAVARSHVSGDYSAEQVMLGNRPSTAETVLEATYKVQLAPWWSVQPDAQYIVTPSGVEGAHDATVLGVRTTVAF